MVASDIVFFPLTVSVPAVVLMVQPSRVTAGGEHEYRLVKYLMSNYEKSVRPARNPAEPLMVKFDVSIHQIIDVDEKNQGSNGICLRQEFMQTLLGD